MIERLAEDCRFLSEYDLYVVFDSESGLAVDTADERGTPYTVADPTDPTDALEGVAERIGTIHYLVACGWGYRVPTESLEVPRVALNCHSSYLPRYKGWSVYRAQWAHAERRGGVTIHEMTEEIDEGEIVTRQRFEIGLFETPLGIARTYSELTVPLLKEAIHRLETGEECVPRSGGGRYFTRIPLRHTLKHGVVNHLLRAVGSERRWGLPEEVRRP